MLPAHYKLLGLHDINWSSPIPEPFSTYEENAKAKAYEVFSKTGIDCFADDSGLEIDALDGAPGVFSARYAGDEKNDRSNIEKVLDIMKNTRQRAAKFIAVIAYVSHHQTIYFKGTVEGKITDFPFGSGGFGYDPIFIPDGFDQTFSELDETIKNKISHRAKAMQQFISFLNSGSNLSDQDI